MLANFKAKRTFEGKNLRSFGVLRPYLTLFIEPASAGAAWSFIFTTAFKFFVPQYLEKIHLMKVPIKHVDHELDDRVPFKEEYLPVYMRFINYWINGLSMLMAKFGIHNGSVLSAVFLRYLRRAYSCAYDMYSKCMTTTYRPHSDSKGIKALRRADPHYFCVPSLHIAIVAINYSFYKKLFAEGDFLESEKQTWLTNLKEEGFAIARSVLYLKQHSVNCIPAALYMVCRIAPELLAPSDVERFMEHVFDGVDDIAEADRGAIKAYILSLFERLWNDGSSDEDWTLAIVRWLEGYQPSGIVY